VARDLDAGRLLIPDPVTVTLHTRNADGVEASQTVLYVQEQAEDRNVATTSPAITEATDTRFHLWAIELNGTVPLKGFKIEKADGSFYTIVRVERLAHGRRFRCHCKKDRPT